jgi:hypothetical protein
MLQRSDFTVVRTIMIQAKKLQVATLQLSTEYVLLRKAAGVYLAVPFTVYCFARLQECT